MRLWFLIFFLIIVMSLQKALSHIIKYLSQLDDLERLCMNTE